MIDAVKHSISMPNCCPKLRYYRIDQEVKRQQDGRKATKRQGRIRRVLTKVVGCVHIRTLLEARER